ncbi:MULTISPECIES: integrase core domain-containing protein [Delftia]|jgi:hypothetical protein|uniref:Integrase catalytic domain-containing protein n=3 Tax=Delftia TaxID=80865 RepID=A0ABM6EA67_9BURK|nr:hypothetical protein BI380_25450 [Delftia tsuruhatensis]OJX09753.1 MAG: hypothetical protein BGO79_20175 [Delftia sp. 67-8]QFS63529.1 transposase [Delftia tsuruhatensis]
MALAVGLDARHMINDAVQNACIESFNRMFHDKCLNELWFETPVQARDETARRQRSYSKVRLHRLPRRHQSAHMNVRSASNSLLHPNPGSGLLSATEIITRYLSVNRHIVF